MTPISALASLLRSPDIILLLYRRRPRCLLSRLSDAPHTPNRAVSGTDIADVAIDHGVGGCLCVGGVLPLRLLEMRSVDGLPT